MKGVPILLLGALPTVFAHNLHFTTNPLYTSEIDFKSPPIAKAFSGVPVVTQQAAAEEDVVFRAAPYAPQMLTDIPEPDDRVYNKAMMYVQLGINFFNIPFILFELFTAMRCPSHIKVDHCDDNFTNFVNNTTPFLRIYARIVNIIALFEKIWMKNNLPCHQLHAAIHKDTPPPAGVEKNDCHISLSSTYAGILVNIGGYIDLILGSVEPSKFTDYKEWEDSIPYNYLHGTMVWVTLDMMRLIGDLESGDYWWYARETGREFGRIWDLIFDTKEAEEDIIEEHGVSTKEWSRLKATFFNFAIWKHFGHTMINMYMGLRLYIDQMNLTTKDRTLSSRAGAWWYPLDIFMQVLTRIGIGMFGVALLVVGQPGYYDRFT